MVSYPSQVEYDALQESGLFLADWYVAEAGASLPKAVDPLMDFCSRGWHARLAPNPYFDCGFYLRQNPDVAEAGLNPLLHYLHQGDREGRRPVAYFDPNWYRATHGLRPAENTLAHFLPRRFGGRASPTADFAPIPYLRTHPSLIASNADPFLHWKAAPDALPPTESEIVAMSGLFDASFYLLCNPDVREAAGDPLTHYCRYGWEEQRNPNLYFDATYYAGRHNTPGGNPLVHYFVYGETEGDRPGPHFDPGWYAEAYGLEPCQSALRHYLQNRRSQRFSPNPEFDVVAYVADYGEVIGRNRDPFAHYLRHGRK
jgi:hypothetical protein